MILSTVSLKGGGGKTTTAVNFAVYFAMKGKSVVIIDTDVNTHIEKWNERRPDDLPTVDFAVLNTPQLLKQNFDDIAARYDVVIVDGRPAVDEIAAIILSISDVAVIPVKPSPLDLWANDGNFIDVYLKSKKHNTDLKAFFLLNEVKPNTDISIDVRAELHEYKESTDIITLEHQMSSRVTYAKAFLYGHGVLETSNFLARGEFRLVADEVVKLANIKF